MRTWRTADAGEKEDRRTGQLFSYVDLESSVRADHPLRAVRDLVNAALAALFSDFDARDSHLGRPASLRSGRTLNKLARTFAMQMDALKRYRRRSRRNIRMLRSTTEVRPWLEPSKEENDG
jgi:hypothetical protein